MSNYIPIFEIKDSFIIKHKLNYDTSYDLGEYDNENNFSSYKQRMIFTDYELARKTQTNNAKNFDSVIISTDLTETDNTSNYIVDALRIEYLDYQYTLLLDGEIVEFVNDWKNGDDYNVINISKPTKKQVFTVTNDTDEINIDDVVTVEIYRKQEEEIVLNWEINSVYSGETFFFSGDTSFGTQWVEKIESENVGYSSGENIIKIINKIPLLKYDSIVLGKDSNTISLENKIETYQFNDFSKYDDLCFKIILNTHCERSYTSILDKLRYFKYYEYFDYKLYKNETNSYLEIIPKENIENIYINYDKFIIKLGLMEKIDSDILPYVIPINYVDDGYYDEYDYYIFTFKTNNIYSKYTLELLLQQFDFVDEETDYYLYNTLSSSAILMDTDIEYLYFSVNSSIFNKYSFIRLNTNEKEYYALIVDISKNIIENETEFFILKVLKPYNYNNEVEINDSVLISNIGKLWEISYILDRTYLNCNYLDFKKISVDLQRKIYYFYADIINNLDMNQQIRISTTGIIFQNLKNRMVLKIFNPSDTKDSRLLYEPSELTLIGKNKKTTLPIVIDDVLLNISADLINPNKNTKLELKEKTIIGNPIINNEDGIIEITFDDVSDFVLNKYAIIVSNGVFYYMLIININGNTVIFSINGNDDIISVEKVLIGFEYSPLYVLNSNVDEILLVIDSNLA